MSSLKVARVLIGASVIVALASPLPAHGQGWGDMLKRKVKERIDRRANEAADKTIDKAEGTVRCAAGDDACAAKARADGKQVTVEGNASATTPARFGEGAWVNYDFKPGERPIFTEDFSRDEVGDFPRRLELIDGNMEVAETKSGRFLRVTSWPGRFAIMLPSVLPERFTMEFDASPGYNNNPIIFRFADKAADEVRFRTYGPKGQGGVFGAKHQSLGQTKGPIGDGEIFRGRVMADGRYVKVYMNDTRVANIPNAELGRSNKITVEIPGKEDVPAFIGNISIMAGGKKLYDALAEKGRVATQGIYFDTGSDHIRPESAPTLKEIGEMLSQHPDLKLTIEGHTDNTGSAASNQTLSEKRAASVRAYLVSNFSVDAGRLQAKGYGASKPAAPNDTPEGRQTNRRVELVRM